MNSAQSGVNVGIVVLVKHIQSRSERSREDGRILRNDGDSTSQISQANLGNVYRIISTKEDLRGEPYSPSPSMTIRPPAASTNRKKLNAKVDFPQPVDPTIPTFSCATTSKLIPWSTLGRSGCDTISLLDQLRAGLTAYLMTRFSTEMDP